MISITYSRRKSSGAVYAPKPIYANSFVLRAKAPEYFEPRKPILISRELKALILVSVLRGGYDGYCISGYSNGGFPDEFPSETDEHGYDSDSDIEDDDDNQPGHGTGALHGIASVSLTDSSGTEAKKEDDEVRACIYKSQTAAI